MRVAIADDSTLFREGLAMLLASAGVEVTAQASEPRGILAHLKDAQLTDTQPDVVILDMRMPPTFTDEGLVCAELIRTQHPAVGVLVLSTYSDVHYAVRLLGDGRGGMGYLLKDRVADLNGLLDGVRRIAAGRLVVDEDIIAGLLAHRRRAEALDRLTERERAVMREMAEGRSNAGIAGKLHLAPKTVENHVASVFSKLGMPASGDDNRRVLAVLAWLRSAGDTASTAAPGGSSSR
ncbi:DNA-binding response regulator [Frankia sp. CcI49]|uniref:response regulator transcription factor n=1 Tax=unclassified Frankia TaxID=2632575 RepID=UPI0006C9FADA|nr:MULTISPECIES: response regulator transcription factor [unclassified Frankia]KPM52782.1 LuxR family transcriptional regulator [Frankia sp. R43]ONH57791.1 DNA-binding response regulator [Frankia sp. CcI49]